MGGKTSTDDVLTLLGSLNPPAGRSGRHFHRVSRLDCSRREANFTDGGDDHQHCGCSGASWRLKAAVIAPRATTVSTTLSRVVRIAFVGELQWRRSQYLFESSAVLLAVWSIPFERDSMPLSRAMVAWRAHHSTW